MSNATRFDLTRTQITDRYRQRINKGDRTKLTREEREILTLILLDRLIELNQRREDTEEAIGQLCTHEIALLEEGYPRKSIANQYLPDYTKLIRGAISDGKIKLTDRNSFIKYWRKRNAPEVAGETRTHYALEYLKYENDQYAQDRAETNEHNNDRQDNPGDVELDPYLAKLEELAQSDEPELMLIAIVMATGRRHVEAATQGQFRETQHSYLLEFEGQAKKRDDQPNDGFEILTLLPAKQTLALIDRFRDHSDVQPLVGLDDEHPDVQKFHARVNRRVEKIFGQSGLVPVLPGFKSVSIHRLRALWGAIAFHFFAPGQKNPQRFLQHYLGHVSDTLRSAANAPVTGHYFHYRLWRNGKELLAKGVKLAANGALPESRLSAVEEQQLQRGEPVVLTPAANTSTATQGSAPMHTHSSVPQAVIDQAATELAALPMRLPIALTDYDRAQTILNTIAPQIPQIDQITALLNWVETHLSDTSLQNNTEATVDASEPNSVNQSDSEQQSVQPDSHSSSDALTLAKEEQQKMTQALIDQAKNISWMCQEIDQLREQVKKLEAERDQIRAAQPQSPQPDPEAEQIRAENDRLKQDLSRLQTEHDRVLHLLEPFKQFLQEPQPTSSTVQQRSPVRTIAHSAPALTQQTPKPKPTSQPQAPVVKTDVKLEPSEVDDLKQQIVIPQEGDRKRPAKTRAAAILAAIFEWASLHPDDTVAVGGTFLEKTFGINRDAANEFTDENAELIEQYHDRFGIEKARTHNRDRNLDAFVAFAIDTANKTLPDNLKLRRRT